MRRFVRAVAWSILEHAWDLVALAGFAALVAGLGMVYLPLSPIVGGASVMVFGIWGAKLKALFGA